MKKESKIPKGCSLLAYPVECFTFVYIWKKLCILV